MNKKNVLLLGDENSVFVYNFALELTKRGFNPQIFDPYRLILFDGKRKIIKEFPSPPLILDRIPKIGYLIKKIFLKRIYRRLYGQYDICHIHYNLKVYSDIAKTIAGIAKKLVISVWGSDYYKKTDKNRRLQKKIYDRAHLIAFLTEQSKDDFLNFYKYKYKTKTQILRLGLRPLEYIDEVKTENRGAAKRMLELPTDSTVIVCGYNAKAHQNHMSVIESLYPLQSQLPSNVQFVFPMSYGDDEYRKKVNDYLKESGLHYKILDTFMSDLNIARLRCITDIMVNVQDTDQLSGSFLEHMYAENVMICGSWLPYDILRERRAFMLTVDSPSEIGDKILHVLSQLKKFKEKSKNNPFVVNDLSRWDVNMIYWDKAYQNLHKND